MDAASPAAGIADPVEHLVREEEADAERIVGWVRILIALGLVAGGLVVTEVVGPVITEHARRGGLVAVVGGAAAFATLGVATLVIVARGWFRRWTAWVFATGDVAIVVLALQQGLAVAGLAGNWVAALPAAWAAPIVLSVGALRYRPAVQVWVSVAMLAGVTGVALSAGFAASPDAVGRTGASATELVFGRLHALQPYLMRAVMLALVGIATVVAMVRARRLLVRAVRETTRRASLARFLPPEIVPLVDRHDAGSLRRGRRQHATLLFVDLRDSTTIAERMEPERLSVFIAAFRRRVARAARAHAGVVDKFVGDGALLVFGVPQPRPDDAARALACARTLQALIQRWNAKRRFDPAVRAGIGVHAGEVFCGVIGDEQRLEFTVLGDAVNVAARIQQATRAHGVPLLASGAVVAAAGETKRWREVSRESLRGRREPMPILAPDDGSAMPAA